MVELPAHHDLAIEHKLPGGSVCPASSRAPPASVVVRASESTVDANRRGVCGEPRRRPMYSSAVAEPLPGERIDRPSRSEASSSEASSSGDEVDLWAPFARNNP